MRAYAPQLPREPPPQEGRNHFTGLLGISGSDAGAGAGMLLSGIKATKLKYSPPLQRLCRSGQSHILRHVKAVLANFRFCEYEYAAQRWATWGSEASSHNRLCVTFPAWAAEGFPLPRMMTSPPAWSISKYSGIGGEANIRAPPQASRQHWSKTEHPNLPGRPSSLEANVAIWIC